MRKVCGLFEHTIFVQVIVQGKARGYEIHKIGKHILLVQKLSFSVAFELPDNRNFRERDLDEI